MITELSTYAQNVYIFVSKTHDNQDENVKETANGENYYTSLHNPIREMVFGKKIKPTDVAPVIERYDWTSGTVYQEFYNKSNTIFTVEAGSTEQSMFVYTSGGNVYKCIDNNGAANSTVEPTHTDLTPREESDGYKWKYMFSVPSGSKFITTEYIPVVANSTVQTNVTAGIDRVFLKNGGKNYTSTTNGSVQSTITSSRFIIENKSITNSIVTGKH